MFEELYEPLPDRGRYWERLKMEPPKGAPTKELLDQMIFAHQCNIPFEDLDVFEKHLNVKIGVKDAFEKIICGPRGGYCFELNALFHELLKETGFDVKPVVGRSLRDPGYVFPFTHRAMVVTIDGQKLFCDVGFGGPMPPCSVPLVDGCEVSSHGQAFRIERKQGSWWHVLYLGSSDELNAARAEGRPERSAVPAAAFLDEEMQLTDFVPLSHYCSTSPSSSFTQKRMVNRRTEDGNVSITNNVFTRTTPRGKEVVEIASEEQLSQILKDEFGIVR